jgi:hypothetical protein
MSWTLETLVPLALLALLGAALPWLIARHLPDTGRGLLIALALSVAGLIGISAALFAGLYVARGVPAEVLADRPGGALTHFLRLAGGSALVWGPVMALSALGLGQRMEARRGARLAARDRDA